MYCFESKYDAKPILPDAQKLPLLPRLSQAAGAAGPASCSVQPNPLLELMALLLDLCDHIVSQKHHTTFSNASVMALQTTLASQAASNLCPCHSHGKNIWCQLAGRSHRYLLH